MNGLDLVRGLVITYEAIIVRVDGLHPLHHAGAVFVAPARGTPAAFFVGPQQSRKYRNREHRRYGWS